MKKAIIIIIHIIAVSAPLRIFPQVGINTDGSNPDASAMLDVKSTTISITQSKALQTPRTGS